MIRTSSTEHDWLERTLESLSIAGCAVVEDVVDVEMCTATRESMYRIRDQIRDEVGADRLERAGELGVLRLMLAYDVDRFAAFLELAEVLAVVDATVSDTAILHLQNGLILPPAPSGEATETFQTSFHRDFPRHLNGYLASVNCFFAVDAFTESNGGTVVVPGTHQRADRPSDEYLHANAVSVECPRGSMVVFDSTLWHAAGLNASNDDRVAINHQFTRSFIKPQVDYVRALGDDAVMSTTPRAQQLLGWYTRVVTSLDEFYRPPDQRLYRSGQG